MYSMSWASLSAQDSSRVIRVWAKPVTPGRTTSRCQYCGISSQSSVKKAGRIGRGPTTAMSPRSTFQSCGTSSRWIVAQRPPDPRHLFLGAARELLAEVGAEPDPRRRA